MNEYKYQVSDAKSGRIIVARSDDLNELVNEFEEMRALLFVEEEKKDDIPFHDDGVIPFKKKDGSTGYKIKEGTTPSACPKCGGTDIELRDGQYGPYFSCQTCYQRNDATYINVEK